MVSEVGRVGDFDYEAAGSGYENQRRADPRIADQIHQALGDATSVLNVGAGAGSYEPTDRYVLAVEPSPAMRARRASGMVPAVAAAAQALPFDDDSVVDAAYEHRSLAVTSNIHPSGFDTLISKTLATATVDRLLHHAHLVATSGDSHRLAEALAGQGVTALI